MADKKISYTSESVTSSFGGLPDIYQTTFYNSSGHYLYSILGKCVAYTPESFTVVHAGRRDVYSFINGVPNIIRSDRAWFFEEYFYSHAPTSDG